MMKFFNLVLNKLQNYLNLSFDDYIQFRTNKSLGKIGIGGFILGLFLGGSLISLLFSTILYFYISSSSLYSSVLIYLV